MCPNLPAEAESAHSTIDGEIQSMKRTILGLMLVLVAVFAPVAHADTLTAQDAKFEAVDHALSSAPRFPVSFDKLDCSRTSPTAFRCLVAFKIETRWKLKGCRARVKVVSEPELKATTAFRRCRELSTPYLSNGAAWRKAMKLVDDGYGAKGNSSYGGSYGRVSNTRFYYQFNWSSKQENCLQEVKVALVDGVVRGNAGEAICTPIVAWPKARTSRPELLWQQPLPSTPQP